MGPDQGDSQEPLTESDPPQHLSLARHRDLRGRERVPWQRRGLPSARRRGVGHGPRERLRPTVGHLEAGCRPGRPSSTSTQRTACAGASLGQAKFRVAGRHELTGVALALTTLPVLTVATSYVSYRFPRARPLLDGEPVVIVENGELIERNLRRERLTPEEVAEEARRQQIASLADVPWAVHESNG